MAFRNFSAHCCAWKQTMSDKSIRPDSISRSAAARSCSAFSTHSRTHADGSSGSVIEYATLPQGRIDDTANGVPIALHVLRSDNQDIERKFTVSQGPVDVGGFISP